MKNNWLGSVFDFFGDALERFNPSAFRFLAAALPYLTPIPVAWLTAHSSAQFLNFTKEVSFIFVFALEGIGLWFTTMLVDAVVDWVRSKNWKSAFPALMLGVTVAIYVLILVDLNVTLEEAAGNVNPALSRVITLLCFLPLITGVGNGYYKLKLEYKTQTEISKLHQEELETRIRQENREERLERLRIKQGTNERTQNQRTQRTNERSSRKGERTNERSERTNNSELRMAIYQMLDEYYATTNGKVAGVSDMARSIAKAKDGSEESYGRYKGYVSEVRKDWWATKQ